MQAPGRQRTLETKVRLNSQLPSGKADRKGQFDVIASRPARSHPIDDQLVKSALDQLLPRLPANT
jgi:hypothetical protein